MYEFKFEQSNQRFNVWTCYKKGIFFRKCIGLFITPVMTQFINANL